MRLVSDSQLGSVRAAGSARLRHLACRQRPTLSSSGMSCSINDISTSDGDAGGGDDVVNHGEYATVQPDAFRVVRYTQDSASVSSSCTDWPKTRGLAVADRPRDAAYDTILCI